MNSQNRLLDDLGMVKDNIITYKGIYLLVIPVTIIKEGALVNFLLRKEVLTVYRKDYRKNKQLYDFLKDKLTYVKHKRKPVAYKVNQEKLEELIKEVDKGKTKYKIKTVKQTVIIEE
jgi:hypothetical protein